MIFNFKMLNKKATKQMPLFCFFIVLFLLTATSTFASSSNSTKIILPQGFDFTSVVVNHFEAKEKFLSFYKLDKIQKAHETNPYGLALANLTIGLVKNDPISIVNAKSLFSITNKTSDNIKEKNWHLKG